jgi:hypothetical protein
MLGMHSFDKRAELDPLKNLIQSNKHRRVHSNTASAIGGQLFSKAATTSLGYSANQAQRYSSTNKAKAPDTFSTPNPKVYPDSVPATSNLKQINDSDMEVYAAKRLKSIIRLQTSLQTNLARFIEMIEKCQKESTKRNFSNIKNDILKIIQELSTFPGISQRRTIDLIKNLEDLFYDLQSRMESEVNNKETNFLFVTNEALNFARITSKICNEFGHQAISLKNKLAAFFDTVLPQQNHPEPLKSNKTEPKKTLTGSVYPA